eukprot:GILK01019764.1.p1 GENE.GILK01019764.1~~GILK01019764.1.p1  ORF type:complete len:106 (-),score=33.32 GILK01019764.1:119-436(-)
MASDSSDSPVISSSPLSWENLQFLVTMVRQKEKDLDSAYQEHEQRVKTSQEELRTLEAKHRYMYEQMQQTYKELEEKTRDIERREAELIKREQQLLKDSSDQKRQ